MKTVLLHTCCAPCAIKCVDSLLAEGLTPVIYWYNPNIHPFCEYKARLDALGDFCASRGLKIIVQDDYGLRRFLRHTAENPDARCAYCYADRLAAAARATAEGKYDAFCTTLLISPYQDHQLLKSTAEDAGRLAGVEFLYRDFRPLFRAGQAEARTAGIYMQKYCGCIFSEEDRYAKSHIKMQK